MSQVDNEVISVVGKGNKERRIYLTPAAKKSINKWIQIRNSFDILTSALFISRNNRRMTTKATQNVVKKYVVKNMLLHLVLTLNPYRLISFGIMVRDIKW